MAITPSVPSRCGPVPGISSSRASRRGGHSRQRSLYHSLKARAISLYLFMTSLDTVLNIVSLAGEGTRLRADRVPRGR
jgi:hypothetical protein